MADDPNKSNKPVNGASPAEHEASSIIDRYEQVRSTSTVESEHIKQHGRRARAAEKQAREDAKWLKVNGAPIEDIISATMDVGSAQQRRQDIAERWQESRVRSNLAAQNTLISKTSTFIGDARSKSRVNELHGSSEMIGAAAQQAGGVSSYFEQERARSEAIEQKQILGRQLTNIAGADKFDSKAYSSTAAKIAEAESREALAGTTMGLLKKSGNDPSSQLQNVQSYLEQATKEENINKGVENAGKAGYTLEDIGTEKSGLLKSLKELNDAFKDGAKSLEEFAVESEEATGKLKELSDREIGVKQAGGGGMSMGDVGKVLELAGRAGAHVARGATTMLVDQQTTQLGNKTAFANTANRIYGRSEEAIMGGNMDALMELTGGSLEIAKKEADRAKLITNVNEGVAQGFDAAAGVGRTAQAFKEGTVAGVNPVTGKVAAVAQGAIEATDAAVRLGDLSRGNIQAPKTLNSYNANLEFQSAIRAMSAKQMQGVYNQGMGSYNAVQGLGDAAGMQAQLMDVGVLGGLAKVGIQDKDALALSSMMGAAGSVSAKDSMSMMTRAGAAAQRGVMGKEEYVGMASQLMGAGGSADDLERAVAAGFDNSKMAGEMVAATLDLSSGLMARGIAGTSATQDMLSKASQNMQAQGMDKNLSVLAAATSAKSMSDKMGNLDFNLGNIMEFSTVRGIAGPNANVSQIEQLQAMDLSDFATLRAGAGPDATEKQKKAASEIMRLSGTTSILGTGPDGQADLGKLDELMAAEIKKLVINSGGLGQKGVTPVGFLEQLKSGNLSEQNMALAARMGINPDFLSGIAKGNFTPDKGQSSKQNELQGADTKVSQANMALQVIKDAIAASKKAGGTGDIEGIFKGLEEQIGKLQENISTEKTQKMALDAANKMEVAGNLFFRGAAQFDKGIGKLFKEWTVTNTKAAGEERTTGAVKPAVSKQTYSSNPQSKDPMFDRAD